MNEDQLATCVALIESISKSTSIHHIKISLHLNYASESMRDTILKKLESTSKSYDQLTVQGMKNLDISVLLSKSKNL